jgi:hypothetical protein
VNDDYSITRTSLDVYSTSAGASGIENEGAHQVQKSEVLEDSQNNTHKAKQSVGYYTKI